MRWFAMCLAMLMSFLWMSSDKRIAGEASFHIFAFLALFIGIERIIDLIKKNK